MEGVGEAEGCSSRQVELEGRVEELSHALGKVGEERAELVKALTASEEQVGALLGEREGRELREEFGRGENKIEGEREEERAARERREGEVRQGVEERLREFEQEREEAIGR